MLRAPWAARAAAVRRVTRGVERMLGERLVCCCPFSEREESCGFDLLGGHGCGLLKKERLQMLVIAKCVDVVCTVGLGFVWRILVAV